MLPQITAKLARFLGPKGLMPTTRRGTVVSDVAGAIGGLEGKLEWKGDREGCIRVAIARVGRLWFSHSALSPPLSVADREHND